MRLVYASAATFLFFAPALPAPADGFRPLVLGDRVQGPGSCAELALRESVQDFRFKNPACPKVNEASSFVRPVGDGFQTQLVVWDDEGGACGRFEGEGHRFAVVSETKGGCVLELRSFLIH